MFNYQTLNVDLHRPSRSIVVTVLEEGTYLEKLFELDGLLTWCSDKIEVSTLLLQGARGGHHLAPSAEELSRLESEKLEKLAVRFQKLAELLLLIPGTTIVDVGVGGGGLGHDWALAADLVVAHEEASWGFYGAHIGIPFFAGGLMAMTAHGLEGQVRGWQTRKSAFELKSLARNGLPVEFYSLHNRDYMVSELIRNLHQQSPLVRMQQKKASLSLVFPQIERAKKLETEVLAQALLSGDWKTAANASVDGQSVIGQFKSAMEVSQLIRQISNSRESH